LPRHCPNQNAVREDQTDHHQSKDRIPLPFPIDSQLLWQHGAAPLHVWSAALSLIVAHVDTPPSPPQPYHYVSMVRRAYFGKSMMARLWTISIRFSRARACRCPCLWSDRAHSNTAAAGLRPFCAADQGRDQDSPATHQTLLPGIHDAWTPALVERGQAADQARDLKVKAA